MILLLFFSYFIIYSSTCFKIIYELLQKNSAILTYCNENDFIEYLEIRIKLYQRPEMIILDEIDLLGHFLEENLVFDERLIKGLTHVQLNGFSKEIDNFFENSGIKPKRKKAKS